MKIIVRPAAATDIEDAYHWYRDKHPELGTDFLAAVTWQWTILRRGIGDADGRPHVYPARRKSMKKRTTWGLLVTATIALIAGCQTMGEPDQKGQTNMRIHYLEIVCRDVAAQRAALERLHGLSFGPPVADLGQARVAEAPDGSLIGVRAPLAEHEQPIIRTYLEVGDIAKAIKEAEAAGAAIAYPPTQQGDTGTWAIYVLGDVQFGLWQR